jgi:hypothetical protein
MATRFAGQKLRATYTGFTGGATGKKLLASDMTAGAIAGAEPLCTQFG